MINIIAAVAKNGVIGHNGKIPWDIQEEKKHFSELTQNSVLIMGRKTFQEIGTSLKNRYIVVISKTLKIDEEHICSVSNLKQAIQIAKKLTDGNNYTEIFICGGQEVYNKGLKYADKLYITFIDKNYDGDTYFPKTDLSNFKIISSKKIISKYGIKLSFDLYKKYK